LFFSAKLFPRVLSDVRCRKPSLSCAIALAPLFVFCSSLPLFSLSFGVSIYCCFCLLRAVLFSVPETCAPSSVFGRRRGEGGAELGRCPVIL
jgi:hypothetical protein